MTTTPSWDWPDAGVGGGCAVTVTPKYCANHRAAAVSLPPLWSMTSVVAVREVVPRSSVFQPSWEKIPAHRVAGGGYDERPLPSSMATVGRSARALGSANTELTKWAISL